MFEINIGDKVQVVSVFWREMLHFSSEGVYTVQDMSDCSVVLINNKWEKVVLPKEKVVPLN